MKLGILEQKKVKDAEDKFTVYREAMHSYREALHSVLEDEGIPSDNKWRVFYGADAEWFSYYGTPVFEHPILKQIVADLREMGYEEGNWIYITDFLDFLPFDYDVNKNINDVRAVREELLRRKIARFEFIEEVDDDF